MHGAATITDQTMTSPVRRPMTQAGWMEQMPDPVLTDDFRVLQPGEMVSIALRDPSLGPISGQVLEADDSGLTIVEPPADQSQSGYFEEIPADRIASITQHGFAPLTMTIADAFMGEVEPTTPSWVRTLSASPTRAGMGLGLGAGLLAWVMSFASVGLGIPAVVPLVLLGFPIGFGLLAGLAIPGWPAWRGYSTGLVLTVIVVEVINSILQPDNAYAKGLFMILVIAVLAGVWTTLASVGFAIATVVLRLRHRVA